MNIKLLDYIQELSKRDKKTLSQKALKVSEESGELAKAVLSYDSAYATRHRFVDKYKILEEAVDTMLTAISVAYDLGFSHEEIEEVMDAKSEKWQELQQAEDNVVFPLPYEIHITVKFEEIIRSGNDYFIPDFKEACNEVGVKSIVLDLENTHGGSLKDVMTSSKFYGDNRSVYEETQRIVDFLKHKGFKVIREKVETVPWHPGSPDGKIRKEMPKNCYFESHISIFTDNSDEERSKIQNIIKNFDAHLSKNVFKKVTEGKFVVMITLRDYESCFDKFEQKTVSKPQPKPSPKVVPKPNKTTIDAKIKEQRQKEAETQARAKKATVAQRFLHESLLGNQSLSS